MSVRLFAAGELIERGTGLSIAVFALLGVRRDWAGDDGDRLGRGQTVARVARVSAGTGYPARNEDREEAMPDTDETRPEDRLRLIEDEAEYLEHEMDQAREAVERAKRAGSLASPGEEQRVSETEPQPDGAERPEPANEATEDGA